MPKPVVSREILADAAHLACRAPSLHNSQPWRFVGDAAVSCERRSRATHTAAPAARRTHLAVLDCQLDRWVSRTRGSRG